MAEIRSRYVNQQVTELIYRLGVHQWRLSEEERFFLHRYLYDSVLHSLSVLGIRVENQDPPLPTTAQSEFLRVPGIPTPPEENTAIIPMPIRETNGH
jgi:hypothetical protein